MNNIPDRAILSMSAEQLETVEEKGKEIFEKILNAIENEPVLIVLQVLVNFVSQTIDQCPEKKLFLEQTIKLLKENYDTPRT